MYENDARRYHILIQLLNWNIEDRYLPKTIAVYGAGNIGKIFKQKVSEKCVVKYFVDREKRGQYIDGLPVKGIEGMIEDADTTLVVTATYDYENIYRDVRSLCPDVTIISLEDILKDNIKE